MRGIATDITEPYLAEDARRQSLEQLSRLVRSATDGIIGLDDQRHVSLFNPASEEMFGCLEEDALGRSIDRFIPQRFRATLFERGVTARSNSSVRRLWAMHADGEEFPVEISIAHVEEDGRIAYTLILRGDADRVKAEEALQESEQRFRLMAEAVPVMLWMSGADRRCSYVNVRWLEFIGRSREADSGTEWTERVHPDDVKRCLDTIADASEHRRPYTLEFRIRRYDGEYRWILASGAPRLDPDGSFAGYIGCAVDTTRHKLAEETLAGFNRKLIAAHEAERTRIARDLHDDISQRMAVLTMELDRLTQSEAPDWRAQLDALSRGALDLASDIQAISRGLHSSKLDRLGLVAAAVSFCRELSEQQKVDIECRTQDVPSNLPEDVGLGLFRVLQEAVNNAVKHACARRVTVVLRGSRHEIRLDVVDDGIGFEPGAEITGEGLGIVSMRERVSLVGGRMRIDSRPGVGTVVRVRVALAPGGGQVDSSKLIAFNSPSSS